MSDFKDIAYKKKFLHLVNANLVECIKIRKNIIEIKREREII